MILEDLSKNELKELIKIYARNLYALDGVWFQSVEKKGGMDEAMYHDKKAWRKFTETEARRIKKFLKLPDQSGLEGLEKALSLRFSALANPEVEFIRDNNNLIYKVIECRVQSARRNKGISLHPCKSVGIIEHLYFAKTIDSRIECETISCFPDVTDNTCACAWRFFLSDK